MQWPLKVQTGQLGFNDPLLTVLGLRTFETEVKDAAIAGTVLALRAGLFLKPGCWVVSSTISSSLMSAHHIT